MTKNNSKNLSKYVCQKVKKYLKGAKPFRAFSAKFPNVTQMIQLTFIYFFLL
jgi:hypothetical protein